uniref:Tc1-like transposase DDE domain-containing protein n=1 Tax=Rhipicephalus pulchellus TaxID=72859 RepID=L7LWI2_RHIPC
MSSLKKDIQAWLSEERVPWSNDIVKEELMKLVDNVHASGDRYRVDCIAEAAGHLVVCLPSYHCQLNPIELVWSDVKGFVTAANKTFKLQDVDTQLWQGIKQVTAEKWKRYVEHVIAQEDVMRKLDHFIDDVVDTNAAVVITLEEETMSSSDLSCDEDHDM